MIEQSLNTLQLIGMYAMIPYRILIASFRGDNNPPPLEFIEIVEL